VLTGKTERFGYFRISGLHRGHYFVRFDWKTKQVVVPISVDRVLSKNCVERSRITVAKQTDRLKWDEAPPGARIPSLPGPYEGLVPVPERSP
jgi:hypothetical protein